MSRKVAYPAYPEVPISKAVGAADFVFTSARGPWDFDPAEVVFDDDGDVLDDGAGLKDMPFGQQVHETFRSLSEALVVAGCTLADGVDCQRWLADVRHFREFNAIYKTYFPNDPPVRSVFQTKFVFCCRVEMKVIACKPVMPDRT